MAKRVGINGFGRIGRNFYRAYLDKDPGFEIVAVNDLAAPDVLGHLLRYDSTHGKLHQEIEISDGEISVGGNTFRVLAERDPSALPWKDMEVDVVVESTGLFTNREGASQHLTAGADKVVISAPATDPDLTIVLGVNDDAYDAEKAPRHLQRVLHDQFGRPDGQDPARQLRDRLGLHDDHPRLHDRAAAPGPGGDDAEGEARSAPHARGRDQHRPGLDRRCEGDRRGDPRAEGGAGRNGDARARPGRQRHRPGLRAREPATADDVNEAYRSAAASDHWEGILEYTEDPIVSSDIVGNSNSCIIDGLSTMANGDLVKVIGWYDNEWGYSCRLVDLIDRLL